MTFVPWNKLTDGQREVVKLIRPHMAEADLVRFAFWIKKNGNPSRRKGHHQLTEEAGAEVDKILSVGVPSVSSANSGPTPTKDQPRRVTGTMPFHLGSNRD